MLQFLLALAGIGIFIIWMKESTKLDLTLDKKPEYNTMITFDPEHYTDIKWFESYREFSRWESVGRYSFRGYLEKDKLPLFVEMLESELEIQSTDYEIEYYEYSKFRADYVLTFPEMERPNISNYPHLEVLGVWTENGMTGYRLASSQSPEKIKEVIKRELEIEEDEFTLFNSSSFAWTRFL